MSLSWELVLRFSFGRGQRRFTRFVALASLLGMMLGVAALITVLSVMNGFSGELAQEAVIGDARYGCGACRYGPGGP